MTREHIISRSQFDGETITLSGLPWCPGPKTVGLASLVAKNLCKTHNNALSPVDREAARFKRALKYIMASGRALPVRVRLNARLIERWLLKTTINLALQGESPALDVTDELVSLAFGRSVPSKGHGFFFIAHQGAQLRYATGIGFKSLIRVQTKQIAMAVFHFHGCQAVYAFRGAAPIQGAFRLHRWISSMRPEQPEGRLGWTGGQDWIKMAWLPPLDPLDTTMQPMEVL